MKAYKEVQSLTRVDFGSLKIPMIVVYDHPEDYPEHYVARVFDVDRPTDVIIVADTLEDIREDIETAGFETCMERSECDFPCIVETWM